MSKFGSLNNFQLTRETYELKQKFKGIEEKLESIKTKTDELNNNVLEVNELKIKEFSELVNNSVDKIVLKKKIDLLEQKINKHKIYSIEISQADKEALQSFLNEQGFGNFYSVLIELGVRTIEDILFLTENDLLSHGFSTINVRKCLNAAKTYVETNQM